MVWKDFLKDVAKLFPFFIELIKPGNKPCLQGQAAGPPWQVCSRAPQFLWLSQPSWAGIKRDFSSKERKGSPFFPPHQKSLRKEQTKPLAGLCNVPGLEIILNASGRLCDIFQWIFPLDT